MRHFPDTFQAFCLIPVCSHLLVPSGSPCTGPAAAGDYDYLPFFYSRIFHLSWQFYGTSAGAEVKHFGDFEAGKFGAIFVKDGKVSHHQASRQHVCMGGRQLLSAAPCIELKYGASLSVVGRGQLRDPAVRLSCFSALFEPHDAPSAPSLLPDPHQSMHPLLSLLPSDLDQAPCVSPPL